MIANLRAFAEWFKAHKAAIGSTFGGLSLVLVAIGNNFSQQWATRTGAVCGAVALALMGAGMAKSDQFYRERKDVIETKVDRRTPRAGLVTIPPTDLKRLVDKVVPDAKDGHLDDL